MPMNEPVGRISALKFILAARQTIHAYSRDSREQRGWMAWKKGGSRGKEGQNKKRNASIIEIGHWVEYEARTRNFNFKCKSANRSYEGGMKVPAIVLIRMRISIDIILSLSLSRVLAGPSAMPRV